MGRNRQYLAWQRQMKLIMAGYQEQLKTIGFAGLVGHPVPNPLQADQRRLRRLGEVQVAATKIRTPSGRKARTPTPTTRWPIAIRR